MKRTIFEIGNELITLNEAIMSLEDQGHPADIMEVVHSYFGEVKAEREAKLDNYATFIADREALAEARASEANRLLALSRTAKGEAERLKKHLMDYLRFTGESKIETKLHKFNVQNAGGALPLHIADNVDPKTVPAEYTSTEVEFNKEAIRKALASGCDLPFARLGERKQVLVIK